MQLSGVSLYLVDTDVVRSLSLLYMINSTRGFYCTTTKLLAYCVAANCTITASAAAPVIFTMVGDGVTTHRPNTAATCQKRSREHFARTAMWAAKNISRLHIWLTPYLVNGGLLIRKVARTGVAVGKGGHVLGQRRC